MADFNSELPVKTVTNGDVAVKLVDGSTVSQALAVDSSGNASVNIGKVVGTAADVNNGSTSAGTLRVTISNDSTGLVKLATGANTVGTVNLGTTAGGAGQLSLDATESATQGTVAAGTAATKSQLGGAVYNSTPITLTNGQGAALQSDASGYLKVSLAADPATPLAENMTQVAGTAVDVNNGAVSAGTLRVTLANNSTGQVTLATGANTIGALTANQSVNVAQIGGAALAEGQTTMSASIPVVLASNQSTINVALASAGTLVTNYATASAVAAAATTTNSYTVTSGKTFTSCKFLATASGRLKAVVSLNAVNKYVAFSSTANPNIVIDLGFNGATCAATQIVLITLTNLDSSSMDIYSTTIGTEI